MFCKRGGLLRTCPIDCPPYMRLRGFARHAMFQERSLSVKDKATLARFLSLAVLVLTAVSLLSPATALAASHGNRPHHPWQHHKASFMRPHAKKHVGNAGGGSNLLYNGGPV